MAVVDTLITTVGADSTKKFVKSTAVVTAVTILMIGGFAYYHFYWKNRFKKEGFNKNLPPARITEAQARMIANRLYNAMYGVGTNYEAIINALKGLGYNDLIMVYNAFGRRKPATDFSLIGTSKYMDLREWIYSEFSDGSKKLQNIQTLTSGFF